MVLGDYKLLMNKLAAIIGHVLRHYDAAIFGWLTPFLAPLLFPQLSSMAALLSTFALLPLSFIGKPAGAFFGDGLAIDGEGGLRWYGVWLGSLVLLF